MSPKSNKSSSRLLDEKAQIFAALGDPTRLSLVAKLSDGGGHSISQLSDGSPLTRQAITKHLRVLEGVGLVHSAKSGRESHFKFDPKPMNDLRDYISEISLRWDDRLGRLKNLLESPGSD